MDAFPPSQFCDLSWPLFCFFSPLPECHSCRVGRALGATWSNPFSGLDSQTSYYPVCPPGSSVFHPKNVTFLTQACFPWTPPLTRLLLTLPSRGTERTSAVRTWVCFLSHQTLRRTSRNINGWMDNSTPTCKGVSCLLVFRAWHIPGTGPGTR